MNVFELNEKKIASHNINIKNIVAKLNNNIELDLSYLSTQLPNSTYEPEKYPSLIFRPTGLSTVLVTRSGIILFTGGNSIDELYQTHQRVSREFDQIGICNIKNIEHIEIVNTVSLFELESEVDLNHMMINLGFENIEYEPEQFPGLVYRIQDGPVVLIFSSGKCVITGTEYTDSILDAANTIRELISSLNTNSLY